MFWSMFECTSVSTLEWAWINIDWGEEDRNGNVIDQAWFCSQVARTSKLELLKWVREEKKCEWDEWTINEATYKGNLEMLKYCFANNCPYDGWSCRNVIQNGHLDCLRFLFDKVKPSRETEKRAAEMAAEYGHIEILKYFVEERKIAANVKSFCLAQSALRGNLDCLKYLVEEAKAPLDHWIPSSLARYKQHTECLHYLREKGCPEPTDEEYTTSVEGYLKEMLESSGR